MVTKVLFSVTECCFSITELIVLLLSEQDEIKKPVCWEVGSCRSKRNVGAIAISKNIQSMENLLILLFS